MGVEVSNNEWTALFLGGPLHLFRHVEAPNSQGDGNIRYTYSHLKFYDIHIDYTTLTRFPPTCELLCRGF